MYSHNALGVRANNDLTHYLLVLSVVDNPRVQVHVADVLRRNIENERFVVNRIQRFRFHRSLDFFHLFPVQHQRYFEKWACGEKEGEEIEG